jgi:iron(III) transport system ATP-binding protein
VPDLTLQNVSKRFADHTALHDLSLTVEDGEIFTLLGPSGCGKSTTLWSIAGLHRPDTGVIRFGERVVFDQGRVNVEPERRNCGVVFQSYAIWPHLSVRDNVGYPLKLRKVPRAERYRRVQEVLELVELGRHAQRYPHELSGGQQQRVALARALAHPPDLLLLDEPFSNLDAKLRDRSREWLKALQQRIRVTTVFVTHDQDEALSMSDRICVMEAGRIRQIGTPTEVYETPADLFVADFVGTANVLPAILVETAGRDALIRLEGVDATLRVAQPAGEPVAVGPISLSIRPEKIQIVRSGIDSGPLDNTVSVKIDSVAYLGDHFRYGIRIGGTPLIVTTTRRVDTAEMTVHLPVRDIRIYRPEPSSPTDPGHVAAQETVNDQLH